MYMYIYISHYLIEWFNTIRIIYNMGMLFDMVDNDFNRSVCIYIYTHNNNACNNNNNDGSNM